MKKEIEKLLTSERADLRINQYALLHRWTKTADGRDVDWLELTISIVHSADHSYRIKARDWEGIVAEVRGAMAEAFVDAAQTFDKRLANGYLC